MNSDDQAFVKTINDIIGNWHATASNLDDQAIQEKADTISLQIKEYVETQSPENADIQANTSILVNSLMAISEVKKARLSGAEVDAAEFII